MYVSMICKDRNEKEKNELYQVLGLLAQREQVQIEDRGDVVEMIVCPQGKIVISEDGEDMIIHANTRHAGAGFHAFVVDICKDIQEEVPGEYELVDDLEFSEDEDFHRLHHVYEDELEYLRNALLTNDLLKTQNYLYEETFFLPIEKKDRIFTSIGDIDTKEFREMHLHDLMDNFYIWNNFDRDAQFFKNCALVLLSKEGVGRYTMMNDQTQKHANTICDYIELAYKQDDSIPLPVNEYNYLCEMLQREKLLNDAVPMEEEVIQYKTKEVYHLFQDAKVVADGASERSFDPVNNALCLMSPYEDDAHWAWLIQASKDANICSYLNELEEVKPIVYHGKTIQILDKEEDGIYKIEAKLMQDERALYFHITYADKKDENYLKQCIKESCFQNLG